MALKPQPVDIQLQGLDTKTDAKLVVHGKMLELENARFAETGRISARYGTSTYQATSDALKRLYSLGKSLYAIKSTGSTGETFERRDATNGNLSLGTMAAPRAWASTIRGAIYQNPNPVGLGTCEASWTVDSAQISGNLIAYLINESDGQRVIWYDTAAQAVVATYKNTGNVADRARIMYVPNTSKLIVALFRDVSADIKIYEFTTSSATLRATIANVYATWPNVAWDWACNATDARIVVACVDSTSSANLKAVQVNTSTWAAPSTVTWLAAAAVTAVGVAVDSSFSYRVFWADDTTGLSTRTYNSSGVLTLATTVVEATGGASESRRAIGVAIDSGNVTHVTWNVAENVAIVSAVWHNRIHYAVVDAAGAPGTIVKTRGAGLASKPYVVTQDGAKRVFALGALGVSSATAVAPISDEQRGYVFLEVSSTLALRARLLYMSGGIAPSTTGDAGISVAAPGRYERYGLLVNLHAVGDPTYNGRADLSLTTIGCAGVSFDSDPAASQVLLSSPTARMLSLSLTADTGYHAVEFDGGLLVTGGVLHGFDGVTMRENGYVTYPTITSITSASPGGSIADGTYTVKIVYERLDARGRVVQSAVSPPRTITIAGGGGVAAIIVAGTMYRLPLSTGETERIVAYRTANAGTAHRRTSVAINSPTQDEWQLTMTGADASIAAYPQVYTDGGELDHWQPSAPLGICVGEDRPYVFTGDEPFRALPAKPGGLGEGPAWFPEVFRPVPSEDGPLTAIAHVDGKLFGFKRRTVYTAQGNGPDASNNGDTLGEFVRMLWPSDTSNDDRGAIDQRSVLVTPHGFIACGTRGFWSLDRPDIGLDVTAYASMPPIDAASVTANNEARFIVYDSSLGISGVYHELVYNSQHRAWSVNKTFGARAVAVVDGTRYFISHTSRGANVAGVFKEDQAEHSDSHTLAYASLRLVTGWLKFGGLQGFQRIYKLHVLGNIISTHSIATHVATVKLSYDYVDTVVDSLSIDSSGATTGSSAYQYEARPSRQKCEAIKVEIVETSSAGGSFGIAGLSALVGLLGGSMRLPAAKIAVGP